MKKASNEENPLYRELEHTGDIGIEINAGDDIELMHDLLTELLQLFAADGFIWRDATLQQRDGGLRVVVKGETFDPRRHSSRGEIKGVTYHQMSVEDLGNEWRARIIFDV